MSTETSSSSKASTAIAIVSWIIVLWILAVFLPSLPLKFTLAPETQHIFGAVGTWMGGILGEGVGNAFAAYGSFAVGGVELLTALVLIAPAIGWLLRRLRGRAGSRRRPIWHALGGLMATGVMAGAVFFHLFTPLGIDVNGDGGFLFKMAVSVLILGLVLFFLNIGRTRQADINL